MIDVAPFQDALRRAVAAYRDKPVIVHSDLFRASRFVAATTRRQELLAAHRDLLAGLGAALRIPAFNYQFTHTGRLDLRSAPVELGPLGEFMRCQWAACRTFDPIFSFLLGKQECLGTFSGGVLPAFGRHSVFHEAVESGGAILMYGAEISTLTLLHYVELESGGPLYRYDKDFRGMVTDWQGRELSVIYRYHVRPQGRHLEYDWPRIEKLLLDGGAIQWILPAQKALGFVLDARALCAALLSELKRNPLGLLDAESVNWIEPELERLGRRFLLSDFESRRAEA